MNLDHILKARLAYSFFQLVNSLLLYSSIETFSLFNALSQQWTTNPLQIKQKGRASFPSQKMKSLNLIIMFTLLASIAIVTAYLDEHNKKSEVMNEEAEIPTSLRDKSTTSRFLGGQRVKAKSKRMTCDKFPRICRTMKSSNRPDCCYKTCVNVMMDRQNCGKCGYRCKYSEICCRGKCVNSWYNKRHCGGCNNKCKFGEYCVYGMCNYAWLISFMYFHSLSLCNFFSFLFFVFYHLNL